MTRRAVAALVGLGVAVSLAVAVFAAPWASIDPDGLERVAVDEGFEGSVTEHVSVDSPAADYSTWVWRGVGVVIVFAIASGLTALAAHRRPDAPADVEPSPTMG